MRNSAIILPLILYVAESMGITGLGLLGKDYLILVLIGFLIGYTYVVHNENRINQTLLLVLHRALMRKNILDYKDVFLAQNGLIGDTFEGDGNKLIRIFRDQSIYFSEYLTPEDLDEKMKLIESQDFSVFQSFIGLADRRKEEYSNKIPTK